MSYEPSRATFSSLRARRAAHQIASDILYAEPIDLRTDPHAVLPRNLTLPQIEDLAEDARLTEWAEAEARREVRQIIWRWSIAAVVAIAAVGLISYYFVYR